VATYLCWPPMARGASADPRRAGRGRSAGACGCVAVRPGWPGHDVLAHTSQDKFCHRDDQQPDWTAPPSRAPAVYLPHTDHTFDLVGTRWSPAARVAVYALGRFLATISATGKRPLTHADTDRKAGAPGIRPDRKIVGGAAMAAVYRIWVRPRLMRWGNRGRSHRAVSQVGPHPLLADPDCVVCGLLAHIPASSRGPSLRLHLIATHPSTRRVQSPVLPGPAPVTGTPGKMPIRSRSEFGLATPSRASTASRP
jgi:hypothetical protein